MADLKSVQYSGAGFTFAFAQNFRPDAPYPKFHATYSRAIDYERGVAREETVRTQFENPPRGGGGQPLCTEARGAAMVTGNSGWGGGAIALTPHGFVKAAMAANPTMSSARVGGRTMTVISIAMRGRYKVNGYVNGQNLVEKIETWAPNPILGDMLIETAFSEYRDFRGVRFPTRILQRQGGFPVLDVTVADVQPNAPVNIAAPAAAARNRRARLRNASPMACGISPARRTPTASSWSSGTSRC